MRVPAVALIGLLLGGCGLDLEQVRQLRPGKTDKRALVGQFGRPDHARARGPEEVWVWIDEPPRWPLYVPVVQILYSIYWEILDAPMGRLTVSLDRNGLLQSGVYEGQEVIRIGAGLWQSVRPR